MTLQQQIESRCAGEPRWTPHVRRYVESIQALDVIHDGGLIVDVGGESPFTAVASERYGMVQSTGTADIRMTDGSLPGCEPESADVVTCLEVIEHLKDQPEENREVWTGGGIRAGLRAIAATLRRKGRLLLSTPNAGSWIVLQHWIDRKPLPMWAPHPRELMPSEVVAFVREAGLTIEREWTSPVWNRHGLTDAQVHRLGRVLGCDQIMREDCYFLVAAKP